MSVMSTAASALLAARVKMDLEFKLQSATMRKMALLDQSKEVSIELTNSIFEFNPYKQAEATKKMFLIQATEKEIDSKIKDMDTQLKIYREMEENFLKAAKENAKQSFTAVS